MGDYRKLAVWRRAHFLVLRVYALARSLPREERFGLGSQLRRAAVSIPTNVVEGCGRNSDLEFARFLRIALASTTELEYLLILCEALHLGVDAGMIAECQELRRMLATLERRLRTRAEVRWTDRRKRAAGPRDRDGPDALRAEPVHDRSDS